MSSSQLKQQFLIHSLKKKFFYPVNMISFSTVIYYGIVIFVRHISGKFHNSKLVRSNIQIPSSSNIKWLSNENMSADVFVLNSKAYCSLVFVSSVRVPVPFVIKSSSFSFFFSRVHAFKSGIVLYFYIWSKLELIVSLLKSTDSFSSSSKCIFSHQKMTLLLYLSSR